jgi:hypothetical protein
MSAALSLSSSCDRPEWGRRSGPHAPGSQTLPSRRRPEIDLCQGCANFDTVALVPLLAGQALVLAGITAPHARVGSLGSFCGQSAVRSKALLPLMAISSCYPRRHRSNLGRAANLAIAVGGARSVQSGRTSAPIMPHLVQTALGPSSLSVVSSGHRSASTTALWWQRRVEQ